MVDAVPADTTLAIHNLNQVVEFARHQQAQVYIVTPTTAFRMELWKLLPGLLPAGSTVSGFGALLPNRSTILLVHEKHPIPSSGYVLLLLGWDKVKDKKFLAAWREGSKRVLGTFQRGY